MNKNDKTPETDANKWWYCPDLGFNRDDDDLTGFHVCAEFAARLERERNDLLSAIRDFQKAHGRYHTQKAAERMLALLPENNVGRKNKELDEAAE